MIFQYADTAEYGGCVSIPTYVEYYYMFSQMNLFIFCREVISRQ